MANANATSTLDQTVVDSVTNANFKAVAEQVAFFSNQALGYANQALADSLQDQRDSRMLTKSLLGSLCKRIIETDIEEGVGSQLTASSNLPGRQVDEGAASAQANQLQVALVAIAQILAKLSQSTPPQTAPVPPPAKA